MPVLGSGLVLAVSLVSERTNQNDKAGPVPRVGQVLHNLLINHEICVIGVWSLRISWWTVTLFPEAEIFAEASFVEKKKKKKQTGTGSLLENCQKHLKLY